jgi:hypothetical protein
MEDTENTHTIGEQLKLMIARYDIRLCLKSVFHKVAKINADK